VSQKKIAKLSSDSDSVRSRSESSKMSKLSEESHKKKANEKTSSFSIERVDISPPLDK